MNKILQTAILALLLMVGLQAQTTGKIAGIVVDKETGEALAGVNISIENLSIGAATDLDGTFYILNVPPGEHNIIVEFIGYQPKRIEGLRVSVNRTSTVSITLEETVLEMSEQIVVVADKITLRKDQTSSIRNVSSEDIEILPVESITDVVALQPGVVNGHMRGGRSYETAYLIDGISVYNGLNRQRMVDIDPDALQEVEVITGTFNAKYGEAMGGIVNMVTKEGGNQFHGKFEGFLENYYTTHTDEFPGLKTSDIDRNRDYKFYIHGPIAQNQLTFFFSTRVQDNMNYLNGIRRFNITDRPDYSLWQNPYAYDENGNYLFNEHSGDNAYVPMNWYQSVNFSGKLTYKLSRLKMSLSYLLDNSEQQYYSHTHKYKPDGRNINYKDSYMVMYQLNHFIAQNAFYEAKLSYSNNFTGSYLYEDPTDPRYIHDRYAANNGFTGFYTGGQEKWHSETTTEKILGRLDFTWQINRTNSIESGFEGALYRYDSRSQDIVNKYRNTAASGIIYEPEVLPDSTAYADIYEKEPIQYAGWISDKMEFEDMVIDFGVRLEYFDPKTKYPSNYRNPGNLLAKEDQPEWESRYIKADYKVNIAPRLGFSYQLGESALLRFSYGHFYQYPPHSTMYLNNSYILSPANYASSIGNPQVKPEKTVNYEIGLWQVLSQYMDLEVAIWYKDIYELSTVNIVTTYNQIRYGLYGNKDYGNARGLEVKFNTRYGQLYSELNYTLQYTRGNADNPTFTYSRAGSSQDPIPTLIPMSWDQRHTLNATIGYNTQNFGLTATAYLGTGAAYTWTPIDQNALHRVNLYPNNSYKPFHYSVDLKAFYEMPAYFGLNLRWSLYVYNLLDRLNEYGVNGNTGRANQAIIRESDLIGHWSDFSTYEDRIYSPSNWSAPRSVKLGLGIIF
jgi:outer membrane receptor protein involved in Fe transport